MIERAQYLIDNLQSASPRWALLAQKVPQGRAIDVLHYNIWHKGGVHYVLTEVINSDDRRVVQRRDRLNFATKTSPEDLVTSQIDTERLDSNDTVQLKVMATVDHAHVAMSDDSVELVTGAEEFRHAYPLADSNLHHLN